MAYNKLKMVLFSLATLLWMGTIFSFSADSGTSSGSLSRSLIETAGEILFADYESWTENQKDDFVEKWQLPVRKFAHMTEYAILALLMWNTFSGVVRVWRRRTALVLLLGIIYAAIDEFHQHFVPGRNGNLFDVGIDSAGIIIGLYVCISCNFIRNRRKE